MPTNAEDLRGSHRSMADVARSKFPAWSDLLLVAILVTHVLRKSVG